MLWAIDVGNTHTVFGLWGGQSWKQTFRIATDPGRTTEDDLAASLRSLCKQTGLDFAADRVVVASVVPAMDSLLGRLGRRWLQCEPEFLGPGPTVGVKVHYSPVESVGADRIANTLWARDQGPGPYILVDFGTATTFDVLSVEGDYLGGAIMTGVEISMAALFARAAKLPQIPLSPPSKAIGTNTVSALQSGIVLGYAGSVEALVKHLSQELPSKPRVIATGGLGGTFMGVCPSLEAYEPMMTLEGLRLFAAL
ncbi:MAG: type III pantothenate kinase [Chthonomonas sp.]|nr:type III pantothenate kinase [Chthonomonas sp.]